MTLDFTRCAAVLTVVSLLACSSDSNDGPTPAPAGSASATGGTAVTTGGSNAATGGTASMPNAGTNAPTFDNEGQCLFEGSGVFENGAYSGTVVFVLLSEILGDEEICRVQFDLDTVADADPECDFCYFSTVVQKSNPMIITNVDDACGSSERALDQAAIDAMVAAPPVAMGFAEEGTGHGEVVVEYDATLMRWNEVTFGSFDPDTGMLTYEHNEGFCNY